MKTTIVSLVCSLLRRRLFDQLESELDVFGRDLELLNHELVRLQEEHADTRSR